MELFIIKYKLATLKFQIFLRKTFLLLLNITKHIHIGFLKFIKDVFTYE